MPDIAGLKLIVPTSVAATGAGSSATMSATGKVTFTSAATLSINGCFAADFDNYLVVMRHVASVTATGIKLRFRASGTDNSTASSYVSQSLDVDGTGVVGGRFTNNRTSDITASSTTQRDGTHFYFYGPYLSQPTAFRTVTALGKSGGYMSDSAGTHNQSVAYDGFTLIIDTAITGALTIYGLAN